MSELPLSTGERRAAATDTIARVVAEDSTVQDEFDGAIGYMAGRASAIKVPIVGGGYGLRLSCSAEYDGFTGSRDAFMSSINWKY